VFFPTWLFHDKDIPSFYAAKKSWQMPGTEILAWVALKFKTLGAGILFQLGP
jgi:hypothetical protein